MIEHIPQIFLALHKLNDNKIIKCKDKYPVLKTRKRKVENWWNSLSFSEKMEVGSIALHYNRMTPNYKWKCMDYHMFSDLTKSQQKIVKFCFSKKNDNWFMFDIASMIKY